MARKRKPTPKTRCAVCNHWFTGISFTERGLVRIRYTAKTCGLECLTKRRQQIGHAMKGPAHPSWRGGSSFGVGRSGHRGSNWARIRSEIRKRDKFTCQDCGVTEAETGKSHDVHHLFPFRQFGPDNQNANKSSNLVTLCRSCHRNADLQWAKDNPIQMSLGLHCGSPAKGLCRPKMPLDLSGIKINNVVIREKVPTEGAKGTRWSYDCLKCGGEGITWRQQIVNKWIHDCGCGKADRFRASWQKRMKENAEKWWVDGKSYDSLSVASDALSLHPSTVRRWCKGTKKQPPKDGCWYSAEATSHA